MKISLILISFCLLFNACQLNNSDHKGTTVHYQSDLTSNLKNPYMGWTLYAQNRWRHPDIKDYWEQQDKGATEYAGVLYIRWKWSSLEPEEGQYAWECDSLFQNLVQGALDRNLRLAFRAFVHTGTPQYVLDGAQTYENWGIKTPYPDDEFFLEKYTKFIEAFGKRFNDPTIVDYVDSYGLGWWGEGHNIKFKNPERKYETHNRIVEAYAKAFDKVINFINFGLRDEEQQRVVYDELGFAPRRDGYASKWFPKENQQKLITHFPQRPIIAEACYWGKNEIGYHIEDEGRIVWNSWGEYYEDVVDLALETHANYLDLRTPHESNRHLQEAPESVNKFLSKGGYRIFPDSIRFSINKKNLKVDHTWSNLGVGILPNNNVSLGHKYKVAFALFDKDNNMVQKWISNHVEVGELVNGNSLAGKDVFELNAAVANTYKLCVGIINTRENDSKDITLAIKDAVKITNEWVLVGDVTL